MQHSDDAIETPERISLMLNSQLYQQVQAAALADDRPMAAWIRKAIREKLEREGENK